MTRLPNKQRDLAGVIVTARDQQTGNMWSLTRGGLAQEALRAICDVLDRAEGDWRVVTVSTPNTILQDLQGNREALTELDREVRTVENHLLGRVGRMDLLEPRRRAYAAETG